MVQGINLSSLKGLTSLPQAAQLKSLIPQEGLGQLQNIGNLKEALPLLAQHKDKVLEFLQSSNIPLDVIQQKIGSLGVNLDMLM